jgi:hypothetical protein
MASTVFTSKTVFVLGAGASKEVSLPLGSELAEIICKKLDVRFDRAGQLIEGGDFRLYETLKARFPTQIGQYQQAGWTIRDGVLLANSIDDFLDRHATKPQVVLYGKLAIVASILEKEKASPIFTSPARNRSASFISDIKDTWYIRLLKLLQTGVPVEQVDSLFENVAFIDFNYDRCLSQFMIEAIQPLYGVDQSRARQIVATAKILHPYGSIGELPMSGLRGTVPYGDPDGNANLFEVAEHIRLYTEQVKEHDKIDEIKREIASAHRIAFLGFGYHQQNLAIIRPKEAQSTNQILGTAWKVSNDDCEVLQDTLRPLLRTQPPRFNAFTGRDHTYRDDIKLRSDLTASAFFDEYYRTLMS